MRDRPEGFTDHLVRSLLIAVEQRVRAEDVLMLSKTAPHAAKVKQAQRAERGALNALNNHLKDCIREHQRQIRKLQQTHLYTPTRRGLKKVKGS